MVKSGKMSDERRNEMILISDVWVALVLYPLAILLIAISLSLSFPVLALSRF